MAKEIFRIKFGHHEIETNNAEGHRKLLAYRMYTLGESGDVDGELLTPQKITIKDNKVKVVFEELGIQHVFTMDDKTEVYYRDKIKRDAKETTD